jgi:hypothetical protein
MCLLILFDFILVFKVVLACFLHEYMPFLTVLFSLFVICGGIYIKPSRYLRGHPIHNICLLVLGTSLASWMGTMGASMLLIRSLLSSNVWRKHSSHVFVFFIFLVGNIGGALSPLGDPPLFIGFLKGVDFLWFTKNMFTPWAVLVTSQLIFFGILDSFLYTKYEGLPPNPLESHTDPKPIRRLAPGLPKQMRIEDEWVILGDVPLPRSADPVETEALVLLPTKPGENSDTKASPSPAVGTIKLSESNQETAVAERPVRSCSRDETEGAAISEAFDPAHPKADPPREPPVPSPFASGNEEFDYTEPESTDPNNANLLARVDDSAHMPQWLAYQQVGLSDSGGQPTEASDEHVRPRSKMQRLFAAPMNAVRYVHIYSIIILFSEFSEFLHNLFVCVFF